ncbi:hypothetical protein Cal7507_3132 [Calothrix sp. PCC 7507]|nr:hypothetical protein Cal7507_3132 [Calothrix sp. PCC 7507]
MFLIILKNAANNIVSLDLVPKILRKRRIINNNVKEPDALGKKSTTRNYLQPFDTAFIAYQMMGLNDF